MSVLVRVRGTWRLGMVRALVLSVATLVIPVAGAFLVPERLADYQALLWLLPLIPAFLLAYHRGWMGIATSLALGMAILSVTYAIAQSLGRTMPDLLFAVVVLYIALALMIGWLVERVRRDVRAVPLDASAFLDAETGLPNRRHADLHLESEFNAALRGRALSVALLGLDGFKAYGGRHGPEARADALVRLGAVLRQSTRRMNLSARFDEDEFLCVLGGCEGEGALVFLAAVQKAWREQVSEAALPSVSAGVATFRTEHRSWRELVANAEEALKRARRDGSGRIRLFGRAPSSKPEPAAQPAEAVFRASDRQHTSRRGLVVVDDEPVRILLSRYLTDHGFKVAQVTNVVDGVQCLNIEYDLLITDISLAEVLGTELVRGAKLRWPAIQVIGVVQGEGGFTFDVLNAGVDRFIERPLDLPRLRQFMAELLVRRERLVTSVLDNRQSTLEIEAEKAEAISALRRSEEEYRTVVEDLQEVIFRLDPVGDIKFLNWAWTATTGHPVENSLGRCFTEFLPQDERPVVETMLQSLVAGQVEEGRTELRLVARDGSLRWAEVRARRTYESDDGIPSVTGTLYDVTRSKRAEERLRRSEAASRGLLAALPDQVFGLSRAGVIVSHSGGRANGRSPLGKAVEELYPPEVAREYRRALGNLFLTRQMQVCEYSMATGDVSGQYEARFALAGEDEAVAIVRDVSERKRLEDQLRQAQKLEAIGRLAGGLAHDFNNLLTVVQGNAHLLIEEYGDQGEARVYAQEINGAANRGAELVRQLLAFGQRQVLQPQLLNLNNVITSVHALLPRLVGEDVHIELRLERELGLVRADPGQLEQVIVQLAVFARSRLTAGGCLVLTTANAVAERAAEPHLAASPARECVRFTFADNGPSLDEQARTHAFEPFYGTAGAKAGGLGLATVYGIVTQSEGTIVLKSAPTGGICFEVNLPRVDAV